jgi:arsenite methyltransferase
MTTTESVVHPSFATRLRRRVKAAAVVGLRRDRWQRPDQVMATLALEPGGRIADIGAGGGYFTFPLARAVGPGGHVYAIDTDPDMIAVIADRARRDGVANITTVAARPDDPELETTVDLALLVNAFHHLPDPVSYLRTLRTLLGVGGRLAVIEPSPRWWMFGHATDPTVLRRTLARAGYAIVAEHTFLPQQRFVIAVPC